MQRKRLFLIFFTTLALLLSGCAQQLFEHDRNNGLRHSYASEIKMKARQGDSDAQYTLGYMMYYGHQGIKQDKLQAEAWMRVSAEAGNSKALLALEKLNKRKALVFSDDQLTKDSSQSVTQEKGSRFDVSQLYGVQLFSSKKSDQAEAFISQYKMQDKASVHQANLFGEHWYQVIYGQYPSKQKAEQAALFLRESLNMHDVFVKRIED